MSVKPIDITIDDFIDFDQMDYNFVIDMLTIFIDSFALVFSIISYY